MTKTSYFIVNIDNNQVKASYDSQSEKCTLTYLMSKSSDHVLANIYDKELAFKKSDISLLISTLEELKESIDA